MTSIISVCSRLRAAIIILICITEIILASSCNFPTLSEERGANANLSCSPITNQIGCSIKSYTFVIQSKYIEHNKLVIDADLYGYSGGGIVSPDARLKDSNGNVYKMMYSRTPYLPQEPRSMSLYFDRSGQENISNSITMNLQISVGFQSFVCNKELEHDHISSAYTKSKVCPKTVTTFILNDTNLPLTNTGEIDTSDPPGPIGVFKIDFNYPLYEAITQLPPTETATPLTLTDTPTLLPTIMPMPVDAGTPTTTPTP